MISLRAVNSNPDARRILESFADNPRNSGYFRRLGPKFTWCNDTAINQMFGTSYFIRDEDEVVGLISIVQADERNKRAEFGILASKLKYAKAGMILFSEYIFDYLGYNKLWCRILSSRQEDLGMLLKAIGFKQEGVLRDECFTNGAYCNEIVYSKLRKEYKCQA